MSPSPDLAPTQAWTASLTLIHHLACAHHAHGKLLFPNSIPSRKELKNCKLSFPVVCHSWFACKYLCTGHQSVPTSMSSSILWQRKAISTPKGSLFDVYILTVTPSGFLLQSPRLEGVASLAPFISYPWFLALVATSEDRVSWSRPLRYFRFSSWTGDRSEIRD